MVKKGMTKVRLRKYFCMVLALMLVASCLCINGGATEITGQMGTPIIMRASGKFEMDIPGHKLVKAKTSFPLEAGEQVTIKASYSPFDANVDFGLITEDTMEKTTTADKEQKVLRLNDVVSTDDYKENIFNNILNSVDYYDAVKGSFVTTLWREDGEPTIVSYGSDINAQKCECCTSWD